MAGLVVVAVAWVPEAGVDQFRHYERAVMSLLADHGGHLQRRLVNEDSTVEVHVLAFPSAEAFAGYRSDPRRELHGDPLDSSGAQIQVFELRDAPIAELVPGRAS